MKARINNQVFDIVEGATFSEEYNETLDSGNIILSQIGKQDFKPYDDVYVYDDDSEFLGVPVHELAIQLEVDYTETLETRSETTLDLYDDLSIGSYGGEGRRLYGTGIERFLNYCFNYDSNNEEKCPYYFSSNLRFTVAYRVISNNSSSSYTYLINRSHAKYKQSVKKNLYRSTTYYNITGIVSPDLDRIVFGTPAYIANSNTGENWALVSSITSGSSVNTYTYRELYLNYDYEVKNETGLDIDTIYANFKSAKLTRVIKRTNSDDFEYQESDSVVQFSNGIVFYFDKIYPIYFVYNNSTNSWQASDTIELTLDNLIEKQYYTNFRIVINNPNTIEKPKFYKHLLIDTFSEERLNLVEDLYKYKITLMSETKRLEKVVLPNLSITQPLLFSKKKSIYEYLEQYLELYNPQIRVRTIGTLDTWAFQGKYKYADKVKEKFSDIYAPDFSLNNPTLREIISQLMIVADCIPVVKDNVIDYLDISETTGVFNGDNVNYIESSLSSEDYTQNLKRFYEDAITMKNARYVEKLGFRNNEEGLMTLENMRIETRFPIYKINKLYMCYYKRFALYTDNETSSYSTYIMLVKQDITALVKLNSERELLYNDWLELPSTRPSDIEEAAKWKLMTVGYDIGDNYIEGWGTTYSYPIQSTWWETTRSYMENILDYMDTVYPYGVNNGEKIKQMAENGTLVRPLWDIWNGLVVPNTPSALSSSDPLKMKCVFFEIDYNAFYNGAIVHPKDNNFGEIYQNDNSSNSLELVETDGKFQKSKINRIGNTIYQINARYDSVDELQELGSVMDDNNIIYHREYAIYDNVVKANYYATKDYVLQNYFTSVWAKHRTYNLMSYSESIIRAENKTTYLYLSFDELYNDDNSTFIQTENMEVSLDRMLLSSFLPNEIISSYNSFIYDYDINGGWFYIDEEKNAFSDINKFVSGVNLCFNIKMYDNVSGGIYINEIAPDAGIIDNDDDYTKGSSQQWLMLVDDTDTGRIETIEIALAHIDNRTIFAEDPFEFNQTTINNIYANYLYKLPLANDLIESATNIIKFSGNIYKDNKEIIDYTFEFAPISKDTRIQFSEYFMLLNNLINIKYKNSISYEVEDNSQMSNDILLYFSLYSNEYGDYTIKDYEWSSFFPDDDDILWPSICINVPNSYDLQVGDLLYFSREFANVSWGEDPQHTTYITLVNARIVAVEDTYIDVYISQIYTTRYLFANSSYATDTLYRLYRYNYTGTLNSYDKKPSQDLDGYKSYGNLLRLDSQLYDGENFDQTGIANIYSAALTNVDNDGYAKVNGLYFMDDDHNAYAYASYNSSSLDTMNKNMYVVYRTSGNVKDSKKIAEIDSSNTKFNITDLNVNNIFSIEQRTNGGYYIDIDFRELDTIEIATTIEYWFYDEDSESYKFVFGVDTLSDNLYNGSTIITLEQNTGDEYSDYKGENAVYIVNNSSETITITYTKRVSDLMSMTYRVPVAPGNTLTVELDDDNAGIGLSTTSGDTLLGKIGVYRYLKWRRVYASLLGNRDFNVYDINTQKCGEIQNYLDDDTLTKNYYLYYKKTE